MAQDIEGLTLTEQFEGYARELPNGDCTSYWDRIGGVWTCGFGTTGADIREGLIWTREQAIERLQRDWLRTQQGVLKSSPILAKFPNRLDAVTDFAYNVGTSRYTGSSMRSYIDRQDWTSAANEFPKWNLSRGKVIPGLVRRRVAERARFLTADSSSVPDKLSPVVSDNRQDLLVPYPVAETTLDSSSLPALFASFGKQLLALLRARD